MLDVFASIKTPIIKDNYTCKETFTPQPAASIPINFLKN